MKTSVVAAIAVALAFSTVPPAVAGEPVRFSAGQRWAYQTRPQDQGSTLIVLRVDDAGASGRIVHVALGGLSIKNPLSPDGRSTTVRHMPFEEAALRRSVTELLADGVPVPPYEEGYAMWREAFDAGRAGYYTVTVAEAVQVIEESTIRAEDAR